MVIIIVLVILVIGVFIAKIIKYGETSQPIVLHKEIKCNENCISSKYED